MAAVDGFYVIRAEQTKKIWLGIVGIVLICTEYFKNSVDVKLLVLIITAA